MAHDSLAALRIPFVRAFALGEATAYLGAQMVSVAVGWDLYERTRDPFALGLVGLAELAPAVGLLFVAGHVADRLPRRNVGMAGHALLAVAVGGLAVIAAAGASVALVYPVLALVGAVRAFAQPATTTLLAQLLPPPEYQNAAAWLVLVGELAAIAGPAVGGLLIALTGGATAAYAVGAAANLAFVAALATLPAVPPAPAEERPSAGDVFAGVRFIWRTPAFFGAIALDLFAVLFGGAVALMPVYARDILAVGPTGLGLLRAAPSVGAGAAALLVARLPPWRRPGRVLLAVVAGFGLATVGFGLSRDLYLSLACLCLVGAFDSVSMVIRATIEQALTPDRLRGRVAAVNFLFVGMSNELGAFESGMAAALFGPVAAVVGGGVGTLLIVAAFPFVFPALVRYAPGSVK
ncbi:MAG TPA: MFS transporter [Chloroflexota bacterium]|nr:MFS transporter [Chloroflexota bacterium]